MSAAAPVSSTMRLSRAVAAVPPSGIRQFFDVVSQMEDVISLGVGEPDFGTAWRVREAAIYGLERGRTTYTANSGLLDLRSAVASSLADRYGLEYDPEDEILITVGVSEGLDLALRALLDPGDEVLIPDPAYVAYPPCVSLAGGVPVWVPAPARDGFIPQADELERRITPRTRVLLLNYPGNPTGAVPDRAALDAIADVVRRHDLVVVSDEIYDRLSYDAPHVPFATLPGMLERTLLLNGFSKTYGMTGWRVGYAAGPRPLIAAMTRIHQYTALCASRQAQEAAIEALRVPEREVQATVDDYALRRQAIVSGLNRLGLTATFRRARSTRSPRSFRPASPRTTSRPGCCMRRRSPSFRVMPLDPVARDTSAVPMPPAWTRSTRHSSASSVFSAASRPTADRRVERHEETVATGVLMS